MHPSFVQGASIASNADRSGALATRLRPRTDRVVRFSCLALLLALPACGDSTPTNGDLPGTFSATVTGTVSATLTGTAVSTGNAATGGWGLVLGPGSPQVITFVTPGNDRPSPGTYSIIAFVGGAPSTEPVFVASIVAEPGVTSYTSTGNGTLTIESSSAGRVSGSFSFEAARGTVGNPSIVNVTGTFDSTNSPATG